MSNTNPIVPDPIDPTWALPDAATKGTPVSAATFARLLAAARAGGWPGVWRTWAEGESVTEADGYPRPARRRTLGTFLDRRPDLRALLEDAANEKRDRLLNQLEDVAEKVALGGPDTTTDYDKSGNVVRVRTDSRNRNFMVLSLLKAHDREKYGEHRRIDVAGQIDHKHTVGTSADQYILSPADVLALSEQDQAELFRLLSMVEESRQQRALENRNGRVGEQFTRSLPAVEGTNGQVDAG